MPEIVVQLHPEAAVSDMEEAASALGVSLQPMHPGTDDPELSRKFRSEVPDRDEAEQVAASLMESDAVEAAYYKPDAELP
jgi:hypothetical protein